MQPLERCRSDSRSRNNRRQAVAALRAHHAGRGLRPAAAALARGTRRQQQRQLLRRLQQQSRRRLEHSIQCGPEGPLMRSLSLAAVLPQLQQASRQSRSQRAWEQGKQQQRWNSRLLAGRSLPACCRRPRCQLLTRRSRRPAALAMCLLHLKKRQRRPHRLQRSSQDRSWSSLKRSQRRCRRSRRRRLRCQLLQQPGRTLAC